MKKNNLKNDFVYSLEDLNIQMLGQEELKLIEGGKAEWLLYGWCLGIGVGILCTGIYVGYNDN